MVRSTDKQFTGLWSGVMCRKRYIDEKVVAAITGDDPVVAVVNLGAGWDTRIYRLPALAQLPAWEVDQAANIDAKRNALQKALGAIPERVKLVPINFVEEDLASVLATQGYPAHVKTFFIWEAVTQYLTDAAVHATLDSLRNAAPGSLLAFTYVLRDYIEGTQTFGQEKFHAQMVVKANIWHFGLNPEEVGPLLNSHGWESLEDRSYGELNEGYVKPTGRVLPTTPIERMAFAQKQ